MRPDRIVLTLPPDPALARLTRLATQHFLRQNGLHLVEARRRGRTVETHVRAALRAARRTAPRGGGARSSARTATARPRAAAPALALTLVARGRALEVLLRRDRRGADRLLRVPRPAEAS